MTQLVGILNLTPDSFSDGGSYADAEAMSVAVARMIVEGAAVIDVGAESTRPGATVLTGTEEWARLLPFFEQVFPAHHGKVLFSLDTRHPENVSKALAYGLEWINDVSGFSNPAMIEAVKDSDCTLVLMHSLTVPADPKVTLPQDVDLIEALMLWAEERIDTLGGYNIARERILFDPGIGFGKTAQQSLDILRRAGELHALEVPLLFGHSRKSCLAALGERDAATLVISQYLAALNIDYLRVHDVAAHRTLLQLARAHVD